MKLNNASHHRNSSDRGGVNRYLVKRNAGFDHGLSELARGHNKNGSDISGEQINTPMTEDGNMNQHDGQAYKVASPWYSPPTIVSEATIFHAKQTNNAAPQVRQFFGTRNLGFTINEDKRNYINVALLLKRVMYFAKQTDTYLRIEPLNGSAQIM
jgi:hypothetical protein